MRIGLVRIGYTPYGGAEVFLSRLVDGLIKRGHECHVFASEWVGDIKVRFQEVYLYFLTTLSLLFIFVV